jgi:alcohol dehydrogenase
VIGSFALGRLPRIRFGPGAIGEVPGIVAAHGTRVLLVTGARSFAGTAHSGDLLAGLEGRNVQVVDQVTVSGEPTPDAVDEALEAHRAKDVEVVLGIGGGSALDHAKAIAGLLRAGTSVRDHLEGVGPGLPYPGPSVPFVAVPTTAGTGSEATRNAVMTERGANGFKRSFRDERLVAADAVVDPDLLAGAPPEVIAANGMDAVTQLLESYASQRAAPITDALALAGLEAAREGLLTWHADPGGPGAPAARSAMAYAALLSGICLANAGLGAVHGLASPLGAFFPIPHGAACGAVLAATIEVNVRALEARAPGSPALARYARIGQLLGGTDDPRATRDLGAVLASWAATLGIRPLQAFGVTTQDIPRIVADSRGSSMRTNPIELTDDEIASILQASL